MACGSCFILDCSFYLVLSQYGPGAPVFGYCMPKKNLWKEKNGKTLTWYETKTKTNCFITKQAWRLEIRGG